MPGIFDPRWPYHHRATVATSELATVQIIRNSGEGGFTEDGWVDATSSVVYEGKARWQKLGQTTKRDFTEDFGQFTRVRVQISFSRIKAFDPTFEGFLPNDKVILVKNSPNPESEGSVAYVWGSPTSSNPWHCTLMCQENMKQVG